ncbi:MAG: hypothetical protein H0T70_01690 [Acidimicrobiia bacterium]|nr:hypothetical protein [Acidimicrobiia bacterium]
MLNAVIEIAIGLIVLFSLLSLMCTKINELIATALALRARNLRRAIRHLAGDAYAAKVYEHALVTSLYRTNPQPAKGFKRLLRRCGPSYIPAEKFVIALLDNTCPTAVTVEPPLPPNPGDRLQYALAVQAADSQASGPEAVPGTEPAPRTPDDVARAIAAELERVCDPDLKTSMQTLWRAASENVVTFRAGVEEWFNDTMDRAAGWYKRLAQTMALVLGLIIAVTLNVDTVHVSQRLWSDGPLRSAVLEQVKKLPPPTTTTTVARQPPTGAPETEAPAAPAPDLGAQVGSIQDDLSQINSLQLPLGWGEGQRPHGRGSWGVAVLGWVLTALALSLGAPFWFDLLNKVTSLRGGGTKENTPTQITQAAKGGPKK